MTNANVDSMVVGTGSHELTLTSGKLPADRRTPELRRWCCMPGTRAGLVVGEYVFIGAQQAADGAVERGACR